MLDLKKNSRVRVLLAICLLISTLQAHALDAYFNHAIFLTPGEGSYVETQMLFNASSLRYAEAAEGFQARIELTYIFQTEGRVADFSKNVVRSPFTPDSLNALVDFLDVQRFYLDAGTYDLTIRLQDLNNPLDTVSINQKVIVEPTKEEAYFSDVLFVDTVYDNSGQMGPFSRGNLDMIPRISGYLGPETDRLQFYTELYHTEFTLGGQEDYIVLLDVIDTRTDQALGNYRAIKRLKGSEVQAIFHTWDASTLPTGNYLVRMEARNRSNELIANTTTDLQRYSVVPASADISNNQLYATFAGKLPEDSLRQMTYCLRHRATTVEERYIDDNWKQGDTTELRRFFYTYWRDRNAIDPETAWKKYHKLIEYTEDQFGLGSGRRHACRTDRARIYLKYGKPNTRVIQNREPNAFPYEIWHYYKLPKKSDAKIVFYDPTRVTNDYVTLHSNIPGELEEYQWYLRLNTRSVNPTGNDEPINTMGEVTDQRNLRGMQLDEVGSKALDFWNNPH